MRSESQWKDAEKNSLLGLRKKFDLAVNVRPAKVRGCPRNQRDPIEVDAGWLAVSLAPRPEPAAQVWPLLADLSPLKPVRDNTPPHGFLAVWGPFRGRFGGSLPLFFLVARVLAPGADGQRRLPPPPPGYHQPGRGHGHHPRAGAPSRAAAQPKRCHAGG